MYVRLTFTHGRDTTSPRDLCTINRVVALVGNRFVSLKATRGTVARVGEMWVTTSHPVVVRRSRTGIYF